MRKPGIPPARIPEITKSSRSGITFTLALRSKHRQSRVATRVVKNESKVKQEVRHDLCENDSSSYGIRGALRVRSVVLFQASSSLGAVGHPCGACCFQNCIQCDRVSDDRCSTALMQACKRGAPSAGVVSSTECSAEVPCTSIRVAVNCIRCG